MARSASRPRGAPCDQRLMLPGPGNAPSARPCLPCPVRAGAPLKLTSCCPQAAERGVRPATTACRYQWEWPVRPGSRAEGTRCGGFARGAAHQSTRRAASLAARARPRTHSPPHTTRARLQSSYNILAGAWSLLIVGKPGAGRHRLAARRLRSLCAQPTTKGRRAGAGGPERPERSMLPAKGARPMGGVGNGERAGGARKRCGSQLCGEPLGAGRGAAARHRRAPPAAGWGKRGRGTPRETPGANPPHVGVLRGGLGRPGAPWRWGAVRAMSARARACVRAAHLAALHEGSRSHRVWGRGLQP